MALNEEVNPDSSSAKRSQTTGHLIIEMPKVWHTLNKSFATKGHGGWNQSCKRVSYTEVKPDFLFCFGCCHILLPSSLTDLVPHDSFLQKAYCLAGSARVVQYTCSVMGCKTGDGPWWITTTRHNCQFATCRPLSVVLHTYMNVCGVIILEWGILSHFFRLFELFAIRHNPSHLLVTRYRLGVLDMYGFSLHTSQMAHQPGT